MLKMAIESQVPKRLSIFQKFEPKLAVWTEFTNTLRTEQLMKFVNKYIVSTLLKREVPKLLKNFKVYAQSAIMSLFRFFVKIMCFLRNRKKSVKCSTRRRFHGPTMNLVFELLSHLILSERQCVILF